MAKLSENEQMATFGDLLRLHRRHRELSQANLAEVIYRHRRTIDSWERDLFTPQERADIFNLERALGLSRRETDLLLYKANLPLAYNSFQLDGMGSATRETVEGAHGYLHILNSKDGDKRYDLNKDRHTLGRDPEKCDLVVLPQFELVSRVHAGIYREELDIYVEDLQSKHGTFVDNQRVVGPVKLQPGQHLFCGGRFASDVVCVLEFSREAYTTK